MYDDRQQLWEYIIIHHPTPNKEDYDRGITPDSVILVKPTHVLAYNKEEVFIKAAQDIPKEHMSHLREVQIAVRPFANLE